MVTSTDTLEVIVRSIFDSKGVRQAKTQLDQFQKSAKAASTQLTGFNQLETIGRQSKQFKIAAGFAEQFGVSMNKAGELTNKAGDALGVTNPRVQKLATAMADGRFEAFNQRIQTSKKRMKEFGLSTKGFRRQFQFEFLSTMFFAMAITRILQRTILSATDSFLKISEGTTAAGRAINQLKGEMLALRFVVGEAIGLALLPMLPVLFQFADAMREAIASNPEKFATGLIGIFAAAKGLEFFSQAMLGAGGFLIILDKLNSIGLASIAASLAKFGVAVAAIGAIAIILKFDFTVEQLTESELARSIAVTGIAGAFSASMAALVFGNVPAAITLGTLAVVLSLAVSEVSFDFKQAFATAGGAAADLLLIAALIAALTGQPKVAGKILAIAIPLKITAVIQEFKLGKEAEELSTGGALARAVAFQTPIVREINTLARETDTNIFGKLINFLNNLRFKEVNDQLDDFTNKLGESAEQNKQFDELSQRLKNRTLPDLSEGFNNTAIAIENTTEALGQTFIDSMVISEQLLLNDSEAADLAAQANSRFNATKRGSILTI